MLPAAFAAYAGIVVLLAIPRPQRHLQKSFPQNIAAALALASAYALPWTGLPLWAATGISSGLWFPLFLFSVLQTPPTRQKAAEKIVFVLVVILFAITSDFLVLYLGIPGSRFSVETLAMPLKLHSLLSPRFCLAMSLFFCGLAGAFALLVVADTAGALQAFSFSSFLVLVFVPLRFTAMPIDASWRTLAEAGIALCASLVFQRLILRYAPPLQIRSRTRRGMLLTPVFCALGGCYFGITSFVS